LDLNYDKPFGADIELKLVATYVKGNVSSTKGKLFPEYFN
jgi:hypothetical protein